MALRAEPAALNIDYEFSSLGILVDGWGGPRPIYANAVRKVDSDSHPETKKYERRVVWCEPPPRVGGWFVSYLSAWVDSALVSTDRLLDLAEADELEATRRRIRSSIGFRLLRLEIGHPGVHAAYLRRQLMGVLVDVVGLSERQAQCYAMAEGFGMSRHEIAPALGISRQMVIRHLRDADARLKRFREGGLPPLDTVELETATWPEFLSA